MISSRRGASRTFANSVACRCTAALAGGGLLLAGCSADTATDPGSDADPDTLTVVTAFYPLHFLTEQVGSGVADATDLTPPGADPHDLELSPVDVAVIEQADVVVYLSGFQPAVESAVDQVSGPVEVDLAEVVDLVDTSSTVRTSEGRTQDADEHAEGDDHGQAPDADQGADDGHDGHEHDGHGGHADDAHDHGPLDPHFWLDAERMAQAAEAVADALVQAAPGETDLIRTNTDELRGALEELDERYQSELAGCHDEVMLVSHLAFGYLAQRYDLAQIGIAGLDPHVEPSPAQLAEIRRVVQAEGVSTIFLEPLASPRVAEALADELDLQVLTLDSLENRHHDDADYLDVMEMNLDALTDGLGCA